jgi:hypothetical protein
MNLRAPNRWCHRGVAVGPVRGHRGVAVGRYVSPWRWRWTGTCHRGVAVGLYVSPWRCGWTGTCHRGVAVGPVRVTVALRWTGTCHRGVAVGRNVSPWRCGWTVRVTVALRIGRSQGSGAGDAVACGLGYLIVRPSGALIGIGICCGTVVWMEGCIGWDRPCTCHPGVRLDGTCHRGVAVGPVRVHRALRLDGTCHRGVAVDGTVSPWRCGWTGTWHRGVAVDGYVSPWRCGWTVPGLRRRRCRRLRLGYLMTAPPGLCLDWDSFWNGGGYGGLASVGIGRLRVTVALRLDVSQGFRRRRCRRLRPGLF